jgi:hypothetical protein
MENKHTLYIFDPVTDEDLRESFEQLFSDVGNNAVERIECDENKKVVHIADAVYAASIASPDDLFNFFEEDRAVTIGLYEDGCWVIGDPEDFVSTRYFHAYKM